MPSDQVLIRPLIYTPTQTLVGYTLVLTVVNRSTLVNTLVYFNINHKVQKYYSKYKMILQVTIVNTLVYFNIYYRKLKKHYNIYKCYYSLL